MPTTKFNRAWLGHTTATVGGISNANVTVMATGFDQSTNSALAAGANGMSTPHILSIFVTATSAGTALGALFWRKLVRHSIRYTIAGASVIASFSALIAIAFDLYGLASNPWVYTTTIFFLSFGIGGVQNGRYLYLLSMSSEKDRPYMQAFPEALLATPLFLLFKQVGLLNTYAGVILATSTKTLTLALVVLRPMFAQVPKELEEAAFVDGCNPFQSYIRIVLPIM